MLINVSDPTSVIFCLNANDLNVMENVKIDGMKEKNDFLTNSCVVGEQQLCVVDQFPSRLPAEKTRF